MTDVPPPPGPDPGPPGYPSPGPPGYPPPGPGAPPPGGPPPGTTFGGPPPGTPPSDGGPLSATWMMKDPPPPGWAPKQKVVAGILGILLGSLGIHSFYLGNAKKGIIQIVVSVCTCGLGGIWGFIEGILILVDNENSRTDAYGIPLTQ
jgi:TM2 domain-containing membrane protein YozV